MTTPLSEDHAERLIERYSRYLAPGDAGLGYYEYWIQSEEESAPGISALVRLVALRSMASDDLLFVRSAIQALACTGRAEDVSVLKSMHARHPDVSVEQVAAIAHLEQRTKSLETLLDEVNSRNSFVVFARALAQERERAAVLEAQDRARYQVDGALGWKNADIASFLYAGLPAFEELPESVQPTWASVAEFLYRGKIIE
jgi:hypothetical protein